MSILQLLRELAEWQTHSTPVETVETIRIQPRDPQTGRFVKVMAER